MITVLLLALLLPPDPLETVGTPTAAEIAASVQPLRPQVSDLTPPAPTPLLRTPTEIDADTAFVPGTAELRPGVADRLRALDLGPVTAVGHDPDPDLATRRAEAVAAVLPDARAEGDDAPAEHPVGTSDQQRAALDRRIDLVPR
jgi:hypothetical protein